MDLKITISDDKITVDFVKELLTQLMSMKESQNVEFVYGKGKRKSHLQKIVECLGEYIVGVDVSSERSDQLTLIPFLEKLESNIGCKYESVTVDAGYESGENYTYLESNNQKAYIKLSTYEKSKTSKFKKDIRKRENMAYNQEDDSYSSKRRLWIQTIFYVWK